MTKYSVVLSAGQLAVGVARGAVVDASANETHQVGAAGGAVGLHVVLAGAGVDAAGVGGAGIPVVAGLRSAFAHAGGAGVVLRAEVGVVAGRGIRDFLENALPVGRVAAAVAAVGRVVVAGLGGAGADAGQTDVRFSAEVGVVAGRSVRDFLENALAVGGIAGSEAAIGGVVVADLLRTHADHLAREGVSDLAEVGLGAEVVVVAGVAHERVILTEAVHAAVVAALVGVVALAVDGALGGLDALAVLGVRTGVLAGRVGVVAFPERTRHGALAVFIEGRQAHPAPLVEGAVGEVGPAAQRCEHRPAVPAAVLQRVLPVEHDVARLECELRSTEVRRDVLGAARCRVARVEGSADGSAVNLRSVLIRGHQVAIVLGAGPPGGEIASEVLLLVGGFVAAHGEERQGQGQGRDQGQQLLHRVLLKELVEHLSFSPHSGEVAPASRAKDCWDIH